MGRVKSSSETWTPIPTTEHAPPTAPPLGEYAPGLGRKTTTIAPWRALKTVSTTLGVTHRMQFVNVETKWNPQVARKWWLMNSWNCSRSLSVIIINMLNDSYDMKPENHPIMRRWTLQCLEVWVKAVTSHCCDFRRRNRLARVHIIQSTEGFKNSGENSKFRKK